MIRVCFAGVTGWTAPPILAAIDAADDLSLTCGVSRSAAGRTLSEATASRSEGSVYASVSEALLSAEVDVLVDYTSAAAVKENVLTAVRAGTHVVVGSSGLTTADYAELDQLARERRVGVIAAGNFSIMAAILKQAAVLAAQHLQNWEILDYARADKPDVPSGTSRELAETLDLFSRKRVSLLAYNEQTSGPETTKVQAAAAAAKIPVVQVTETTEIDDLSHPGVFRGVAERGGGLGVTLLEVVGIE